MSYFTIEKQEVSDALGLRIALAAGPEDFTATPTEVLEAIFTPAAMEVLHNEFTPDDGVLYNAINHRLTRPMDVFSYLWLEIHPCEDYPSHLLKGEGYSFETPERLESRMFRDGQYWGRCLGCFQTSFPRPDDHWHNFIGRIDAAMGFERAPR